MLDKRREANSVLIKREQFCSGISASLSKAILPLPLSFPLSLSTFLLFSALQSFGIPLYLSYTTGSFREAEEAMAASTMWGGDLVDEI